MKRSSRCTRLSARVLCEFDTNVNGHALLQLCLRSADASCLNWGYSSSVWKELEGMSSTVDLRRVDTHFSSTPPHCYFRCTPSPFCHWEVGGSDVQEPKSPEGSRTWFCFPFRPACSTFLQEFQHSVQLWHALLVLRLSSSSPFLKRT